MATITANITSSATLIPLSAAVDIGYYSIDSENFYVTGMSRGADGRDFERLWASVDRAVGGSTAATHTSGATLTRYYPDAATAGAVEHPVYVSIVDVTDAQMKLLHDDPAVLLVAAPGAGKTIHPIQAFVARNGAFTAYTNVAAGGSLDIGWDDALGPPAPSISFPNDAGEGLAVYTAVVQGFARTATPYFEMNAAWGPINRLVGEDNENLVVHISGQATPLTGGNPANLLRITVLYFIIDIA